MVIESSLPQPAIPSATNDTEQAAIAWCFKANRLFMMSSWEMGWAIESEST